MIGYAAVCPVNEQNRFLITDDILN